VSSAFPLGLDALATNHAIGQVVAPEHVNDAASAINALEAEVRGRFVNVRHRGAVGGDATLDSAAFAQAATDLAAGGVLVIPATAAPYILTVPVVLPSNVVVLADGGAAVVQAAPTFVGNGLFKFTGADGVAIFDVRFDGNMAGGGTGYHCLRFDSCSGVTLRGVTCENAPVNGVYVLGSASDFVFDGCDLSDNGGAGLEFTAGITLAAQRSVVANCRADRNVRAGLDLGSNGRRIQVTNNACDANGTYGIYADGGEDPLNGDTTIAFNTVTGPTTFGFVSSDARRLVMLGNSATLCTVGYQQTNLNDATLIGNVAFLNAQYGFNFDIAGPYTADPPAGTARDSNPSLYRINDAAKRAYVTPSHVTLLGNKAFDNGTALAGTYAGFRVRNGARWTWIGNDCWDDRATPTQKYPVDCVTLAAPTFPAWSSGVAYTTADVVSGGGAYYQCIAAHTSGASTEPGVGASWATVWALSPVQPWATGHAYAATDWATNGGAMYAAAQAHTSGAGTEPGVGVSWATAWTLKTVTLDAFWFVAGRSTGHTASNQVQYTGTNLQLIGQEGMQSRFADQAKFLADVFFGSTWKISPQDASSAVNLGIAAYTTVLLGTRWQTSPGSDTPITLKRQATATSGAQNQRSSRLELETSQWNGASATQRVLPIQANGSGSGVGWVEILAADGTTVLLRASESGRTYVPALAVGNGAAGTVLGSVTKKVQVFDIDGNSLGYVPVYDAIT
jgi:hypothetical protein